MAQRQSMAHFETFARLHRGISADLKAIEKFCEHLPAAADLSMAWWTARITGDDGYVLIATECQLIVGIAVLEHAPSAPEARLAFLCVQPDARGRGIGQLLLATLIGRARSEGAALVRAIEHGQAGIGQALLRAGFSQLGGGTWCFGLWNAQAATSYGELAMPEHEPVTTDHAAAQALLMAMGTLDTSMLLTRRARQVIAHELERDGANNAAAGEMALATARRRYVVHVDNSLTEALHQLCLPDMAVRIAAEEARLTPERVLGHLSRGHLCLLRLVIARLSGEKPTWYLVNGFDGYLFRLHDVTRRNDPADPLVVTAAELRLLLGSLTPDDHLAIGRLF